MEAAMQFETVVENLEQLNREKNNAEGVAQEATRIPRLLRAKIKVLRWPTRKGITIVNSHRTVQLQSHSEDCGHQPALNC